MSELRCYSFRYGGLSRISEVAQCLNWASGVLGSWGEGLFIFRELGNTANYFMGAVEQALTFGD